MFIKTKTIRRLEWKRLAETSYAEMPFSVGGIRGITALLLLNRVTEPLFVETAGGQNICIADAGYTWIEIAPESLPWWLTVMFDRNGRLVQYYFDITPGNTILPEAKSFFQDLFLDIVMTPGGAIEMLDEDELEAALRDGTITQEQFHAAKDAAERLFRELPLHEAELEQFCYAQRNTLMNK